MAQFPPAIHACSDAEIASRRARCARLPSNAMNAPRLSSGTGIASAKTGMACGTLTLGFAGIVLLGACRTAPSVHVEKSDVRTGEDVVVIIDGDLNGRTFDRTWIAFQPADASDSDVSGRVLLRRDEHRVRFRTSAPGAYEVRVHDRYPKSEQHLVARIPVRVDGYAVKTGAPLDPVER